LKHEVRPLSPQEGYYQPLNVLDTMKSFVLGWTLDDYTVKGTSGLGKTHRAKALRTVVGGTPAFALSPILKPPVFEKDTSQTTRPAKTGCWPGGDFANALRH